MDEYTRALLEEAFDLNDLACEQYERLEKRTRQAQTPTRWLVHKTYEGPQPPVQPQSADLDEITMSRWDLWLDRRVGEHLEIICRHGCRRSRPRE